MGKFIGRPGGRFKLVATATTAERLLSVDAAKAEMRGHGYVRASVVGLNSGRTSVWKFESAELVTRNGRGYVLCKFRKFELKDGIFIKTPSRFGGSWNLQQDKKSSAVLKELLKKRQLERKWSGILQTLSGFFKGLVRAVKAEKARAAKMQRRQGAINRLLETRAFLCKRAEASQKFWWRLTALVAGLKKGIGDIFVLETKVVNGKTVRTLKLTVEPHALRWASEYWELIDFVDEFNQALNAGLIKGWLRDKFRNIDCGSCVIFA